MIPGWSPADVDLISTAGELEVSTRRPDQTLRPWQPIWVVVAGEHVYVRSWHRRDTGWFGHAVRTGSARIRVADLEREVTVEDIGVRAGRDTDTQEVCDRVDAAYAAKYSRAEDDSVAGMVTPAAVATTLRLAPASCSGC